MSDKLSNSLADLAERVREAQAEIASAEVAAAARALDAGGLLCRAREECRHGEWLPFLARAGVQERQAQRLMQLARSGLKADTVSDLGGIKAALAYLSKIEMPKTGEVLLVGQTGWADMPQSDRPPVAMIWPAPENEGFYEVAVFDPGSPASVDVKLQQAFLYKTKRPVRGDSVRLDGGGFVSGVWETVDGTLGVAHSEREFTIVPAAMEDIAVADFVRKLL